MPASADNRRITISTLLISREKIAEHIPCLIEAERAKSSPPRVDLPIAGRAARITIWPGCSPLVSSSNSMKPVGDPPAHLTGPAPRASISSRVASMISDSGA